MLLKFLHSVSRRIDPKRSLIARAMYLIGALAIVFSTAAAIWVGGIARTNVLEQHVRRLSLETDQLSSDLSEALAARVGAVNTARMLLSRNEQLDDKLELGRCYEELVSAYPQLDWIAVTDATGTVMRSNGSLREGSRVDGSPWFVNGLNAPWIGVIEDSRAASRKAVLSMPSDIATLGDLSIPLHDNSGHFVGVVAARLSWRRTPGHAPRLTDETELPQLTEAYVLNAANVVLVGPAGSRGRPWSGVPIDATQNAVVRSQLPVSAAGPVFERLADGRRVLVARATLNTAPEMALVGLQVLLSEPNERVYQRANVVTKKILWASLSIGAIIAFIGALGIRHLTRRLERLTLSVASVRRNDTAGINVPDGIDEVSQLGEAFSNLIADLAQERSELKMLADELERRVTVRTREVERLAEESRYAAVVRERLILARALHDTLAHSMMAIISEIRFIRRLQTHDPASVPDELRRAEELAHDGLSEARSAITQLRATTVREAGLGPALSGELANFADRTGLVGEFITEPAAAQFGDERSEVLLRMTQEALRNIDRHAKATHVRVTLTVLSGTHLVLRIEDDGVGFDPQLQRLGHYGIVGLYEQAELIGAQLRIAGMPPHVGTTITISLPLSPIVFATTVESSSGL